MKRIFFAAIASLALVACTDMSSVPSSPGAVADQTKLDEQVLLSLELGYKAARLAAELAVDLGKLKGEDARRVQIINRRATSALVGAKAAYDAANARSYRDATGQLKELIAEMVSIIGGKGDTP